MRGIGHNMTLDVGAAYDVYRFMWGGMRPGTPYYDPIGFKAKIKIDARPSLQTRHIQILKEIQRKAFGTTAGGVGTAGQAMIPVFVDPTIVDQERREVPMREIIPRVTNLGITADWNERTARGRGKAKLEDASLLDDDNTYDRYSKLIKYMYAVGRTTGPLQAAMPPGSFETYTTATFPNAQQLEVVAQTTNLAIGEETDIVNGNPGGTYTSMATNTDTCYDEESALAAAFPGIKNQISDENQDDQAGGAITLNDVNDMINLCWEDGGRPTLLHTDGRTVTDLKALMEQHIRVAPVVDLSWGFETISFNGPRGNIPMIQSQMVRTTAGDGNGTIYGSKSILSLDMAMIENRVLQDYTYEPLAHVNDSNKFMIKYYGCPIVRGVNTTDQTSFHGSIIDIA